MGRGGVYVYILPPGKRFGNVNKIFLETFFTPKPKIGRICTYSNCNFSIPFIIY